MSDLRIVKGNDFTTLYKITATYADGTIVEDFDLRACTDVQVIVHRTYSKSVASLLSANEYGSYSLEPENVLRINWDGLLVKLGTYTVDFRAKFRGADIRSYSIKDLIFDIVETNEEANIPTGAFVDNGVYVFSGDFVLMFESQVQADWDESDTSSPAYIKNKPTIPDAVTEQTVSGWGFTKNTGTYSKPSGGIPPTDLSSDVQTSLGKADTALQSFTETDPTVPQWAKQTQKPTYTAQEVGALPNITKYGSTIDLDMDSATYVLTLALKDQDGTVLNTKTVDLPIESVVVNGRYDAANKKIVLTLQSGSTIDVPVGDLIAGLQTEITSVNTLDADLVDDTNSTHKFVTAQDKTNWNNKSDFSGSYNDLSNKPTIPTVPTNVSAFTNDAGYLTSHQDISGKEDKVDIVSASGATLTAEVGKYYTLSNVGTLAITLPTIAAGTTKVQTVTFYISAGSSPAVTFTSTHNIYYADGFEIEPDSTCEVNALYNGAAWIVASVTIIVE